MTSKSQCNVKAEFFKDEQANMKRKSCKKDAEHESQV